MGKPFIVLGDSTNHGGKVIEGSPYSTVEGKPIARVGDKVTCPMKGHGGVTTIITGDGNCLIDGKPAARDGDKCACGCTLIASQSLVSCGGGGGGSSGQSRATSTGSNAADPNKSNLFDDHYVLHDANGKPLPNCAYAVEYPDGTIEYGTTDSSGKTKVFETDTEAKELIFYRQGA